MIARRLAIAFVLLAAAPLLQAQIQFTPPVTVQAGPGVTVKYLALAQSKAKPHAAVILFAGGNGLLNLQPDDTITTGLSQNFLVRSRTKFAQKDLFVAVVDTPNQVAIGGDVRLSAEYAAAMGAVIQDVRGHLAAAGKVWLVGTSSGSISAASIAARLPRVALTPPILTKTNVRRPDGLVLTSSVATVVAGVCGRTVFDANLGAINVSVLVTSHQQDGCACSPPTNATGLLKALKRAPSKQSISFTGGDPPQSTDPCQALTPHGYLGIEDAVVAAIAGWIASH